MTILGKMMAIFVLVLSILQGALTVMLFVSRAQWVRQNALQANQVQIASASTSAMQAELEQARGEAKNERAALEARIVKLDQDLKAEAAKNTGLQRQLADEMKKTNEQTAIAAAAQVDAKTRQADNERMLTAIKERDKANSDLVADNKKEREDRVNAEIQMRTAVLNSQKMEERLRDAMRDLAKRSQPAGTTTTVSKTNAPNPPQESVEGLVSQVDQGGLMKLTIGSDAGLREGHTLDLYRIAAVPSQSQYLGMVRIRKVTPNEAVAEPVGRMAAQPQRGDQVSSRILGGS
jgi:hypothetical protein